MSSEAVAGEIVVAEPRQPKAAVPIKDGILKPNDFEGMFRLADALAASGFAPKGLDRPEQVFAALAHGSELGLTPMQSMQSIAVINGKPSIYGDAGLALVRASGLLESFREYVDGDGDNRAAVCESKRKGMPEARVTRFSVGDAKRAGLWGKAGPWAFYPERMLMFRARAFNLRDEFGDVLKGLAIAEEAQDIEPTRGTAVVVSNEPAPTGTKSERLAAKHAPAQTPKPVAQPGESEGAASSPVAPPAPAVSPKPAEKPPFDPDGDYPTDEAKAVAWWSHDAGINERLALKGVTKWLERIHEVKRADATAAQWSDLLHALESGSVKFALYLS